MVLVLIGIRYMLRSEALTDIANSYEETLYKTEINLRKPIVDSGTYE